VGAGRPRLLLDLRIESARYSLMGVTVAYALTLHNDGPVAASDLLIRAAIGNAGAQQQALLQAFLAKDSGLPVHSLVAIAPGETLHLSNELRLTPEEIVPVAMGQRSLLVPLAMFDLDYRWTGADGAPAGQGRVARAFILGQEQEPPTERLAPFRLDQGPRQYRRAAARAAGELTAN